MPPKEEKPVVMLAPNVSPPDQFNFQQPEKWPVWRKRFERYATVSKLNSSDEMEKIDTCLYCMGEKSEEILLQINSQPNTLEELLKAFDTYFQPQKNVIFERFKFNSRIQRPGEPVDEFITDIHKLAENCEFQNLKDELIRDRIVVGMQNVKVSEQLQLKPDLTLKTAIDCARQAEMQSKQTKIIRDEKEVNLVRGNRKEQVYARSRGEKCMFCGYGIHNRLQCPARNASCNGCKKIGHFKKVCKGNLFNNTNMRRNVNLVHNDNVDNYDAQCEGNRNVDLGNRCGDLGDRDEFFLGSVCGEGENRKSWYVKCFAEELNCEIIFMVDTGAECICLPSNYTFPSQNLLMEENVRYPKLTAAGGSVLKVVGSTVLTLGYMDKVHKFRCFLVEGLKVALLSLDAIELLEVVSPPKQCFVVSKQDEYKEMLEQYPNLFKEMGEFRGDVGIKLKPNYEAFVQSVPRNVAIPFLPKLKAELDRLTELNIIEPIEEVTEWVSPIVVVPKSDKEIRLCVDYTHLNKAVMRPYFPIEKVEMKLGRIKKAKFFSKIDCNKGFYQIKLREECQHLTCFICPFGRYIFKRLPFGISCAPEYFVTKFSQILTNIENVLMHIDDILIYGDTKESHDETLKIVLDRLSQEGITINKNKSVFGVDKVTYLGYVLSKDGVSVDSERVAAILKFPQPTCKVEVQRFLGMINYLARFIKMRSSVLEPLNSLVGKNEFVWSAIQEKSFSEIKSLISRAPTLSFFDPGKQIIVSSDASSYGLGACLMQIDENTNERQLVAYASRSMTDTEKKYFQIEREALALVWAADKFSDYINGIKIIFETDHKPLVQLLQTKPIDTLSLRIQRFRMRLMRYTYEIKYIPGKELIIADALSRSPLPTDVKSQELEEETEMYVNLISGCFPVKDDYLEKLKMSQSKDLIIQKLRAFCHSGWPSRNQIPDFMIPYYQYRNDISFANGLVLYGSRIIIPPDLQKQILEFIHMGHQGLTKCRRRAQISVWWIGLSAQLEKLIKDCNVCIEHRINPKEPFLKDKIPSRPMERAAADLFKSKLDNSWYLIVTDYYSRYFEIYKLESLTDLTIIEKLKKYFATFGICSVLRTDNGPQFDSYNFKQFCKDFNIVHNSNSPYFSQSNGAIEAAVKVAKSILYKNKDKFCEALLSYRSTPLENGFSPAELMMGRKIKTHLPILPALLEVNNENVIKQEERLKTKTENNYNKRHKSVALSELKEGDRVWITDRKSYGIIVQKLNAPRSYLVETDKGRYRRNRWHLIPAAEKQYQHYDCSEGKDNGNMNGNLKIGDSNGEKINLSSYIENCNTNDETCIYDDQGVDENTAPVVQEFHENRAGSSSGISRAGRKINPPSYLKDYIVD